MDFEGKPGKKESSHLSETPKEDSDEWRTNPDFFALLNREFKFNYDFAASEENALAKRFFTKENSALEAENWFAKGGRKVGFLNPPFSMMNEFLKKANEEAKKFRNSTICFLTRGDSMETKWFRSGMVDEDGELVHDIRLYYPRIPFIGSDGKLKGSPSFPTAILIIRGDNFYNLKRGRITWHNWKLKEVKIPF